MANPKIVPHDGDYTPPWTVIPCEVFEGSFAIADTKDRVVARGLTETIAEDWKQQLDKTGWIDHDPA